jgi:hypothetical protein
MSLRRIAQLAVLSIVITLATPLLRANAQNLPQAPNAAAKAAEGGLTAGASLQREGGSALEPYLVTWLIPVFGAIILIACVIADRRLRRSIK